MAHVKTQDYHNHGSRNHQIFGKCRRWWPIFENNL
jgi:hypothetical protein